MKKPLQQGNQLLADIDSRRCQAGGLHLWWLGQSGFLVQYRGRHLLIDPYLSDSLSRKYAGTDKPHERISELVIEAQRLGFADVVTSSHNHTDHLDADTLRPLLDANPDLQVALPAANLSFAARRLGVAESRLRPIDEGQALEIAGFTIEAVPAAHESLERDHAGRLTHLGYVIGCGSFRIYHSGDTVRYPGQVERLRPLAVDVALLPINGRAPERRVAGNLTGDEAARLAHDIAAGCVIPCHYDLFAFNTASPDTFVATCRELGQEFVVLEQGQGHSWES